ncbi:unnamed protein product [marine sediment metagenome]|uniref:Uncharacterized protein n=1 Tax=marine sediment metagenome TaxID=412755 RepID=X1RPJ7_9ZZZZ
MFKTRCGCPDCKGEKIPNSKWVSKKNGDLKENLMLRHWAFGYGKPRKGRITGNPY